MTAAPDKRRPWWKRELCAAPFVIAGTLALVFALRPLGAEWWHVALVVLAIGILSDAAEERRR